MDILDASSLLAYLKQEKGFEKVKSLITDSFTQKTSIFIHQVNFIEVIYKCAKIFGDAKTKKLLAEFQAPFFGIINYMEQDMSFYTAHLKTHYQISLADAIGLAYTKLFNGTFWTADHELQKIAASENIALELIR